MVAPGIDRYVPRFKLAGSDSSSDKLGRSSPYWATNVRCLHHANEL